MLYLMVLALGLALGATACHLASVPRRLVEREQQSWLQERLDQAEETVSLLSKRVNDMISNPDLAVKAAEKVRKIVAKDRFLVRR